MNDSYTWYSTLIKPSWAPPSWVFGPVWTFLYIIIAITFGLIFYKWLVGKLAWQVALPFVLNILFNFAFTPIQFGLKNNMLAAADITLVLVTLVWGLISISKYMRWIVFANLPYLAWVLFATILQFSITYLNKG